MGFREDFIRAAQTDKISESDLKPELLIPNVYNCTPTESEDFSYYNSTSEDLISGFLQLLAGGRIDINYFFSFAFRPIQAFFFILTSEGSGLIHTPKASYSISENDFIILDCSEGFSINSVTLPWRFKIFFFDGQNNSFLTSGINSMRNTPIVSIDIFSSAVYSVESLLRLPVSCGKREMLVMNNALNQIITEYILHSVSSTTVLPENTPSYLIELKNLFDNHYDKAFSLALYEEVYKINRYRICREFSSYYGTSPLKYLTKIRMENAKKMLLTTDLNIYEISNNIGIDNVNHFINVFKRHTGSTPGAFRQQARAHHPS